jgi:hypothetical protein
VYGESQLATIEAFIDVSTTYHGQIPQPSVLTETGEVVLSQRQVLCIMANIWTGSDLSAFYHGDLVDKPTSDDLFRLQSDVPLSFFMSYFSLARTMIHGDGSDITFTRTGAPVHRPPPDKQHTDIGVDVFETPPDDIEIALGQALVTEAADLRFGLQGVDSDTQHGFDNVMVLFPELLVAGMFIAPLEAGDSLYVSGLHKYSEFKRFEDGDLGWTGVEIDRPLPTANVLVVGPESDARDVAVGLKSAHPTALVVYRDLMEGQNDNEDRSWEWWHELASASNIPVKLYTESHDKT